MINIFPKVTDILDLEKELEDVNEGNSFKFDFETGEFNITDGKLNECSYKEKIKQYIEVVLRTPKNKYKVYDDDFGLSIYEYIGNRSVQKGFVLSELERELGEQLINLKDIEGITDFKASLDRRTLNVSFRVQLSNGDLLYYGDDILL